MRLPQYSGPFKVGAIDLEIPVREPRSFGTEVVPNEHINAPPKNSRNFRKKKPSKAAEARHTAAKNGAEARTKEGADDHDADANKNKGEGDRDEDGDVEEDKSWNPFTSGAKTSTLHLATVLFTVYYPTDLNKKDEKYHSHVSWIGRPKRKGLAAMFNYLGQYGIFSIPASPALLFLLSAEMPALVSAPLADPTQPRARAPPPTDRVETGNFGAVPPRFPVIVFSHGLAGNRLTYSQFCGELASQGVIVAAVEHRDGSGIASMVRPPTWKDESDLDAKQKEERSSSSRLWKQKRPKATVPYFQFERIGLRSFAEEPNDKERALRKAQMAMRAAELEECLHVLKRIANGEGAEVAKSSTRGLGSKLGKRHRRARERKEDVRYRVEEEPKRLASWKDKLDTDFPCLVGHSFGGATVIEMQRKGPIRTVEGQEESKRSLFPFTVILDPWMEPLEVDDDRPMMEPAYVINSESFTVWQDHFNKLKRVLHVSREASEGRRGWLMTLCGCNHLDFSDMPFLLPRVFRSTVGPRATIAIFSRATYAQMGLIRQRIREQEQLPGPKAGQSDSGGGQIPSEGEQFAAALMQEAQGEAPQVQSPGEIDLRESSQTRPHEASQMNGQAPEEEGRSKDDNPKADDYQWSSSLDDSPLTKKPGAERDEHMSSLRERKGYAAEKLKKGNEERKMGQKELKALVQADRKKHGLETAAVIANRTSDGDLRGQRRLTNEDIDFSLRAVDVDADRDAEEVHKSLEEISEKLDYKKPRAHSLMGLMFLSKGIRPGLAGPGKVLIHQY